jgi:hypothetical protein
MTQEKWEDIKGKIKDGFTVEDEGRETFEDEGGMEIEYIIFEGPLGKMKLEFIAKPIVLDRKTIYSSRIGSGTTVEYVYSKDEKSYRLEAYKWNDESDDWMEMKAEKFGFGV